MTIFTHTLNHNPKRNRKNDVDYDYDQNYEYAFPFSNLTSTFQSSLHNTLAG